MAPSRKANHSKKNLRFEIVGLGMLGFGVLFAMPMLMPDGHAGAVGYFVRSPLVYLFGRMAFGVSVIFFLGGLGCFLEEVHEGASAGALTLVTALFVLIDIAWAQGKIGSFISGALHATFGELTFIVLIIAALMIVFHIFEWSVKRAIGRGLLWARTMLQALFDARLPHPRHIALAMGLGGEREANPSDSDARKRTRKQPETSASAPVMNTVLELPRAVAEPQPPLSDDVVDVTPKPQQDAVVRTVHEDLRWSDAATVEGHTAQTLRQRRNYVLPDLALFDQPTVQVTDESSRAKLLVETLASFGVEARVVHTERGPSITRYELAPARGVKISRITSLADDIALALAATSVRIEAPIPGKSAIGIEVPNAVVSIVAIREIIEALPPLSDIALPMALGKDITGRPVYADLGKMPHLLVAGATGAGKSVCLNNIIASLLATATPDQVQLLMIDPKRVELTVYNGIPHLVKDVITDARMAAGALFEMTKEMDSRYERFAQASVRKIEEYNRKFPDEQLPYVVIIIDELADLMLVAPAKVETTICRLAQLARATGIHLIVATQRPSVDVITGIIKANIPSRIAFAVSSQVDSRTILDMAGAERLLGRGDMLFLPIDAPKPRRAQGALITGEEVSRLVAFWAAQGRPKNLVDVEVVPIEDEDSGKTIDPLSYDAARFIIESNYASTAQLQSHFQIGHPRAVRLMKCLEEMKVVGQHEGTKPRKILIGIADLELMSSRFGKGVEENVSLFEA